ncbi:uncharacterized protein sowahd [Brachyhypopomus gauderio]|uniref:uncharacterized protein sowahd n=1 Tax=Brachyhypopomus gauderio TaxID=698409 RepID=UPI0040426ECB
MYKDMSDSGPNTSETLSQSHMGGDELILEIVKHTETKTSSNNVSESECSGGAARRARAGFQARASKAGARSLPLALSASTRRSRFQRQLETCDPGNNVGQKTSLDPADKGSLTPAMRKKYLKDLFVNYKSHSGLSHVLSLRSAWDTTGDVGDSFYGSAEDTINSGTLWALDPLEHAWMLSTVDGNFDTMVEFLSEDPSLLTRKDFVSGYTVLHWLAKNGKHETLINLLKHAEKEGVSVNVNSKGSGGQTPLHVAAMHHQYMVMKVLVGAFSADVDVMDYNGKRPWQYLKENASLEMKELLGAWDDEHTYGQLNVNNNGACAESNLEELQESSDQVETFSQPDRWGLGSFVKLLTPFFTRSKN